MSLSSKEGLYIYMTASVINTTQKKFLNAVVRFLRSDQSKLSNNHFHCKLTLVYNAAKLSPSIYLKVKFRCIQVNNTNKKVQIFG